MYARVRKVPVLEFSAIYQYTTSLRINDRSVTVTATDCQGLGDISSKIQYDLQAYGDLRRMRGIRFDRQNARAFGVFKIVHALIFHVYLHYKTLQSCTIINNNSQMRFTEIRLVNLTNVPNIGIRIPTTFETIITYAECI